MVYDPIDDAEIEAGQPTKQELWNKVQDDLDDHEARIQAVETGSLTTFLDMEFPVVGDYSIYGARDGLSIHRVSVAITILAGRVMVFTAGSAGTTEIDIEFKRGGGAWTSLFNTKPSVASGAGDFAVSSNGVLNSSNVDLEVGDLIRLNIDSVQTNGIGLMGLLSFEKTP